MVKRLAALASAGAILLSVAAPALAFNLAVIKNNDATALANSGENTQFNGISVEEAGVGGGVSNSGGNSMTTGDAKAKAKVGIFANNTVVCGCLDGDGAGSLADDGNVAIVKRNSAGAMANSGANDQENGTRVKRAYVDGYVSNSGGNSMTTGDAKAKAKVFIVVNNTLSWPL